MNDRISINPNICGGQACIKGTRIPVHQIVKMLANGDTMESLLADYPTLTREDILAAQTFRIPVGAGTMVYVQTIASNK